MVLVAVVSSTVATEFRRETYAGISRVAQIQNREQDVNRLYEVSRTMSAGDSLQDVLPQLVGRIGSYLNAQVGVALLHDWESNSLTVLSPIWTFGEELVLNDYQIDLGQRSDLTDVFLSRQSKTFRDLDKAPQEHGLLGELGISSALAVPLTVENRTIGVMVLADKTSGPFTQRDLEVFESLAAPAALILAQLERYEEAAETSRRMEELAQMKTDFVSVVSHELRTPLTSIIGSLATIARPELIPPSPASQELLATARKQSDRLRRLIEDLLMVSRIDNDALPQHPENIDMASFAPEQVNGIPGAAPMTTFDIEPDLVVEADPDHLSRVLRNLIENALEVRARIHHRCVCPSSFRVGDDRRGRPRAGHTERQGRARLPAVLSDRPVSDPLPRWHRARSLHRAFSTGGNGRGNRADGDARRRRHFHGHTPASGGADGQTNPGWSCPDVSGLTGSPSVDLPPRRGTRHRRAPPRRWSSASSRKTEGTPSGRPARDSWCPKRAVHADPIPIRTPQNPGIDLAATVARGPAATAFTRIDLDPR